MRVVLDTNVFVSALLGGSLQVLLIRWGAGSFELIVSDEIVQEYLGVLRRPKFDLPSEVVDPIMAQIFNRAEFVTPDEHIEVVVSAPNDNKFLEAAVAGEVEYLVSGDSHYYCQ
jgi:uncharacterized protein